MYCSCFVAVIPLRENAKKTKGHYCNTNSAATNPKPSPFAQSDRIAYSESLVIVKPKGVLEVTEHITIYNGFGEFSSNDPEFLNGGGANNEIKKGIIRNFPTKYVNDWKAVSEHLLELKEVLLNGEKVNWQLKGSFEPMAIPCASEIL